MSTNAYATLLFHSPKGEFLNFTINEGYLHISHSDPCSPPLLPQGEAKALAQFILKNLKHLD